MKKFLSYLEEQLEIDEVSYKGLSNYRKAAKEDIKNIDKEAKKIPYRGFTEKQLKQHDKLIDKKLNRIKGIDKAYKKMRSKNPGQYPVQEAMSKQDLLNKKRALVNKIASMHPEARFETNPLKRVMSKSDREASKKNLSNLLQKKMKEG